MSTQFSRAFVLQWSGAVEMLKNWRYSLMTIHHPHSVYNKLKIDPLNAICDGLNYAGADISPSLWSSSEILMDRTSYSNGVAGYSIANFTMITSALTMIFFAVRALSSRPWAVFFLSFFSIGLMVMATMIPWQLTNDWAMGSVISQLCFQISWMALTNISVFMPNLPPLPWNGTNLNFTGDLLNPNGTLSQMAGGFAPRSNVLANAGAIVPISTLGFGIFVVGGSTLARRYCLQKEEERTKGLDCKK